MDTAKEIASQLLQCKAARLVNNQQDFQQTAEQILTDGVLRDSMGQAGRSLIEKNKGALDLTLKAIEKLI
jgi:3-deoxy-D-manno-octulosonic-acid transferase